MSAPTVEDAAKLLGRTYDLDAFTTAGSATAARQREAAET
jgi:hypothetical protein